MKAFTVPARASWTSAKGTTTIDNKSRLHWTNHRLFTHLVESFELNLLPSRLVTRAIHPPSNKQIWHWSWVKTNVFFGLTRLILLWVAVWHLSSSVQTIRISIMTGRGSEHSSVRILRPFQSNSSNAIFERLRNVFIDHGHVGHGSYSLSFYNQRLCPERWMDDRQFHPSPPDYFPPAFHLRGYRGEETTKKDCFLPSMNKINIRYMLYKYETCEVKNMGLQQWISVNTTIMDYDLCYIRTFCAILKKDLKITVSQHFGFCAWTE